MNPTNAVALTGLTVVVGKWANGEPITIRIVVGITGAALGLAILSESSSDLAGKIGTLMLIGAVFIYAPAIIKKTGLDKANAPKQYSFKDPRNPQNRVGGGGGGGGGGSW